MRTASIALVSRADTISLVGRALIVATRSVVAALDRWQARRQALRQLYMLDRRTLKDIGLDRTELESIAYGENHGRRRYHAGR